MVWSTSSAVNFGLSLSADGGLIHSWVLACGRIELCAARCTYILIGQACLEGHAIEDDRQQALNGLRLRGLVRVQ